MSSSKPVADRPVSKSRSRLFNRRVRIIGVLAVAALIGALYGFLRTPSWYDPPIIEPAHRQSVRNNLVAAQQSFTEALRSSTQPFVYHLYQEDVNRWIAMRREIFPLIDEQMPPEWADPFVVFDEDGITIAGRHTTGNLRAVFSLDLAAEHRGDATILRAMGIRCGSVSLPLDVASDGLCRKLKFEENDLWPGSPRVHGDLQTGIHIGAKAEWRNGGFVYRVQGLKLVSGRLDLTVESLGRQPPRRRKTQP